MYHCIFTTNQHYCRFQTLWRGRHQAWPRMEEGGQVTFKVPPHGIEFTLPSPKVGVESLLVVDPPWMPHIKPNVEEVTLSQIQHVSSSAPEVSRSIMNFTWQIRCPRIQSKLDIIRSWINWKHWQVRRLSYTAGEDRMIHRRETASSDCLFSGVIFFRGE